MAAELSLEALREEIDRIDEVIVRLLDRRARCAFAIGRLKKERGLPIYEPQREATVLARRIMDEARRIQRIEAKVEPEPVEPDDFVERV
jgi:chorismate mutase